MKTLDAFLDSTLYSILFNTVALPGVIIARLTYRKNVPSGTEITGYDVGLTVANGLLVWILIALAIMA